MYQCVEGALKSMLNVITESKNLRQDLKEDIVKSLSTLHESFSKLKAELAKKNNEIRNMHAELECVKDQLHARE